MTYAQRLAARLHERGLSGDDLARLTGYRPETVAAILAESRPAPDAFKLLADAVLFPRRRGYISYG